MRVGEYLYGIASISAGILDLLWGGFEAGHQPIQAWGDHLPGVTVFAYIAAAWLIAGGAAILWRPTARAGAVALAILYSIFAVFWFPRFYTAPHYLGYHAGIYIGVLAGVCQQIILVVAALIIYARLSRRGSFSHSAARAARWTFGLCTLVFGLAHLTFVQSVIPMVPKIMPLGGTFWAVFTGIAFVLAGVAIVSGVLDVLATRLLALMLLVFSVVVLTPIIFSAPHDHTSWGGNAYNLAAVGATLIAADWLDAFALNWQTAQDLVERARA